MPAEGAYVLSPADVRKIRSYVQHKYGEIPQEKSAEIVADAVHRIIDKQLPLFNRSLKRKVTESLIRSAVLEEQRPVRKDDIFTACLSLDRSSEDVTEPLFEWVGKELGASFPRDELNKRLDKLAADKESAGNAWEALKEQLLKSGYVGGQASTQHEAAIAEVIAMPVKLPIPAVKKRRQIQTVIYGLLSLCLLSAVLMYGMSLANTPEPTESITAAETNSAKPAPVETHEGLPLELRYTEIDKKRLTAYLNTKSSLLAEQPYFDAIVAAAKDFDIHPVLLFAITGQEQAFVPRTHEKAQEIANNPFNVFHSWKDFNTTIQESAEIAARTVTNISRDRPQDADPFTWINQTYAEDPNWSNGVRSIFKTITNYLENNEDKA